MESSRAVLCVKPLEGPAVLCWMGGDSALWVHVYVSATRWHSGDVVGSRSERVRGLWVHGFSSRNDKEHARAENANM